MSDDTNRAERTTSLTFGDVPVYHLTAKQVLSELQVDVKSGLSSVVADQNRELYGSNALPTDPGTPWWKILLHNLLNSITLILVIVFIVTMINAEYIDSAVIMFIIWLNALIGFVQELKSEQSVSALQQMAKGVATVIRDDATVTIGIDDVVVGDIITLKAGDQVPADCRVVQETNLELDEALLTGESVTVFKHIEPLPYPEKINGLDVSVAVGDRGNMIFRQTSVVGGAGLAVVTATGFNTKVGQLSKRLSGGGNQKTDFQRRIERFMYILFAIAIVLSLLIFAITEFTFTKEVIVYACSTAIALLPEALIMVTTLVMALAMNRMAQKHAIVRKMNVLATIGTLNVICSDKTGTLTEGKMVVKRVWPHGSKYIYHVTGGPMDATGGFGLEYDPTDPNAPTAEAHQNTRAARAHTRAMSRAGSNADTTGRHRAPSFQHNVMKVVTGTPEAEIPAVQEKCEDLAIVCAMCNNTQLQYDEENDLLVGTGNPTELALQVFTYKLGMSPFYFEDEGWIKCGQWAFDSSVKCMSVGVMREVDQLLEKDEVEGREDGQQTKKECLILCKGAPEAILPKCNNINVEDVMKQVSHLASQGYRVLACSIGDHLDLDDVEGKRLHDYDRPLVESNLRFVGLAVVFDPPREESFTAVEKCRYAGINFIMVTGDHHDTAENIARRLKILEPQDGPDRIITGPLLDAMSVEQIDEMPELPLVIARCSPESKVKMVEALHRRGLVVAMTGDGINDAASIKIADVGFAMGIAGTDLTKQAADVVLADDNIATLVNAIEEGRHITESIKKFIVHLLTSNIAEVVVLLCGLAFRDDEDEVIFPLSALQILWVNLATSSPPAIGISTDPIDPDIMKVPSGNANFFTLEVCIDQFVYGAIVAILTFLAYIFVIFVFGDGIQGSKCNVTEGATLCKEIWRARTTTFAVLNELLLVQGYICRDPRKSTFTRSLVSNPILVASFILGTLILLPLIYIPWAAKNLFKHAPIDWEWLIVLAAMIIYVGAAELYKFGKRWFLEPRTVSGRHFVTTEDGGRIEMIPM